MAIRLFHRTTREGAEAILANGFRDGEDGGVWFSRYLDCWGEQGRHLLEVLLDVSEDTLDAYAIEVVADEVCVDIEADIWESCDEDEVETFVWYKVPAAVVNARGTARRVPPDEITELFS